MVTLWRSSDYAKSEFHQEVTGEEAERLVAEHGRDDGIVLHGKYYIAAGHVYEDLPLPDGYGTDPAATNWVKDPRSQGKR